MSNQIISEEAYPGAFRVLDLDPEATVLGYSGDDFELLASLGGGETRRTDYTGTKALMLAVLEDGVRAFLGSTPRLRAEAELWVASSQPRWIFSFDVVCETLGLEPDCVRRVLARWRAERASPDALREARRDRMRQAARRRRLLSPLES